MRDCQITATLSVMSFVWSVVFFVTDHAVIGSIMGIASVLSLAVCYREDD